MDSAILHGGIDELNTIKESVLELTGYQEQNAELEKEEIRLEKLISLKEKELTEEPETTLKKRKSELVTTYESQLATLNARDKKVRAKKEKDKGIKVSERIAEETLELREHNYKLFDDTSGSIKVNFNKPLNKFSSDIAKIMDGERKNITVKSELYDGDEVIRNESVFTLPYDWETEMLAGVEIALYSNEEQTEIYEYPGHGIDHTIYVTNSLG
jgi:hypothetical protein